MLKNQHDICRVCISRLLYMSRACKLSNVTELCRLTVSDSSTVKCSETCLNITGPPKCPPKEISLVPWKRALTISLNLKFFRGNDNNLGTIEVVLRWTEKQYENNVHNIFS